MQPINPKHQRPVRLVGLAMIVVALAACGSSGGSGAEADAAAQAAVESTTTPTTTPTTSPPTTVGCGSQCPLTDEQQDAVDAFFEAYNGDDWDAVLATISGTDPSWLLSPTLLQDAEDMRADFVWSTAMSETWTPTTCVDQYGTVRCTVEMEDDLVRAFAANGLEPSVCPVSFNVVDGLVEPVRYDQLGGCHFLYDGVMHAYGDWFAGTYPELGQIQGFHYRGWNTSDDAAAEHAGTYVEEFHAYTIELLGADFDIATTRPGA